MNGASSNDQQRPARPAPPPVGDPQRPSHNPGWQLQPAAQTTPPVRRPQQPVEVITSVPSTGTSPPAPLRMRRWLRFAGLSELLMALPWLWWSWLSIQFLGLFSTTVYRVVLTLVLLSGFAIFHRSFETVLARKVHRLREPSEIELRKIGPAWWAVCTAAGVDPNAYQVWIHEGPEATASITYGHTVAVSNWAVYTLPPRNLEAILAHELAHHLALPRRVSLFLYWLSLPARAMGWVIVNGLKHKILRIVVRLWIVVLTLGVFVLGYVTQFDYFTVMMLSAWASPLLVPWLSRKGEQHADRTASDLGFGVPLVEVFANREFERASSGWRPERFRPGASQPIETTRLRWLEKYLKSVPSDVHQRPWAG